MHHKHVFKFMDLYPCLYVDKLVERQPELFLYVFALSGKKEWKRLRNVCRRLSMEPGRYMFTRDESNLFRTARMGLCLGFSKYEATFDEDGLDLLMHYRISAITPDDPHSTHCLDSLCVSAYINVPYLHFSAPNCLLCNEEDDIN